jgi:hypothetical protein
MSDYAWAMLSVMGAWVVAAFFGLFLVMRSLPPKR